MKVIKPGNPNGWETELTCTGKGNGGGGCGTILSVDEHDIFITTSSSYDHSVDYFYSFKCPCCNVITDFEDYSMPLRVRTDAMERYRNNKKK